MISTCFLPFRYHLKETTKISLIDILIVAAMGPPGGARNPVTQRFTRHFNQISTLEFSDETMTKIFSALMASHMKAWEFPSDTMVVAQQIVAGTLVVRCFYSCFTPRQIERHCKFLIIIY